MPIINEISIESLLQDAALNLHLAQRAIGAGTLNEAAVKLLRVDTVLGVIASGRSLADLSDVNRAEFERIESRLDEYEAHIRYGRGVNER